MSSTAMSETAMSETSFGGARVVVTGGTGFIGNALLTKLRSRYPDVIPIALSRPTSDIVGLQRLLDYPESAPSVLQASLHDIPALERCVRDANIVIHLAAEMDFFASDTSSLIRTNVEGTRNLLEACARETKRTRKKLRFVYVSSTEAIGCTEGFGKASEDVPRRPDSDYGRTKLLAEDVVKEYATTLETVVARPTGVYGPGERFFFFEMMKMVASGIAIVAPSPMTGRLMFTHVDDVIQGLMVCATHPNAVGRVFHVSPDESVTNRQIIVTMADILQVPRPALFLSQKVGVGLMRLIAPVMNFRKRRVFLYHPVTVRQSMRDREYSNKRLKVLGYTPRYSILSGTEHTLRYEMRQGNIRRQFVPSALKACVNCFGVMTFVVHRLLWGRRYESP